MDEESIDRRAHWVQWAITGIIIATAWCVRLEFTVSGLKSDMESQKKNRDEMISQLWNKLGADHDKGIETRAILDCLRLKNCK